MRERIDPRRRRHAQRIKLGILIVCTPWLLLGLVGLVSAGVTAARAARLPLDQIRPLALGTLAVCTLVSLAGLVVVAVGIAGLLVTPARDEREPSP